MPTLWGEPVQMTGHFLHSWQCHLQDKKILKGNLIFSGCPSGYFPSSPTEICALGGWPLWPVSIQLPCPSGPWEVPVEARRVGGGEAKKGPVSPCFLSAGSPGGLSTTGHRFCQATRSASFYGVQGEFGCPPKFTCWNLTPSVMVLGGEGFGRWLTVLGGEGFGRWLMVLGGEALGGDWWS